MGRDFAYLASFGKRKFCLLGRGAVLPVRQTLAMAENRIKELREARNMTLEALAEAVGLSTSYVQRLEHGDRNLAVKHLDSFAGALSVTPRELLVQDDAAATTSVVSVVGRIGAGAEIFGIR